VAVLFGLSSSVALAAFPGRNGLLVVQPQFATGLFLVDQHGGHQRHICTQRYICWSATLPRWSSDGRTIVFNSRYVDSVELVYPDGSCLDCASGGGGLGGGRGAAFTSDRTLVSFTTGNVLIRAGIDAVHKGTVLTGPLSDAVWSAQGLLAVVRAGRVWAGRPGSLRLIGSGGSPSWSPDGSRIAFARGGWVLVAKLTSRSTRRLVAGAAPAWSPDGRSIAYIARNQRLSVVLASGGRSRRVGHVKGVAVDWQPIPTKGVAGCAAPDGSKQIASSAGAVVSVEDDAGAVIMGCLLANAREHVLESFVGQDNEDNSYGVLVAAVAGDYAAVVNEWADPHYGGSASTVALFDLRTGTAVPHRGGEQVSCSDFGYDCGSRMDGLVLGSDAVSAVHTRMVTYPSGTSTTTVEEIVASDSAGPHTVDSASGTGLGAALLTNLALAGDTLTWDHAGSPRSAQLQP
jgi:hypothetical protein